MPPKLKQIFILTILLLLTPLFATPPTHTNITNDINNAHIAILDHSKDVVTREITRKLLSSHYFLLDRYLKSNNDIEEAFKEGKIKEVVIFESDFAKKLKTEKLANIQLILDASEPNTANILNSYTSGIVNSYILNQMKQESAVPVIIAETSISSTVITPGTNI